MKSKVLLIGSLILNFLFIVLLAIYLFTPYLDLTVVNTSIPRLCATDATPTFCDLEQ